MNSIKKQARLAGLVYFSASLPAPLGLVYVPNKLIALKFTSMLPICEVPIILWLLIWGARAQPTSLEPVSSTA